MTHPPWLLLVVLAACGSSPIAPAGPDAPVPTPPLFTPRWAFEPWISKDISDTADCRAFVAGFAERNIPVGALVIDSPWMTHYTTFTPSPSRYAGLAALIEELHARGVRIVFWTTQMINESSFDLEPGGDSYDGPSPNHPIALANDYLVNNGESYFWWKGVGGGIDFFNDEARTWWHRQQDPLLDLGADGWKLDFGENYIRTRAVATAAGVVSHQAYSEEYYRDFWAYGVERRGREFLTMVRPWDESYDFSGRFYAKKEHAPVAWVGDNRRDFIGLADALDHLFRSAAAGYAVIGSDIGGYLDRDDQHIRDTIPFDVEAFARWTEVATWWPFFQLHGRANLAPWTVPERTEEVVRIYRLAATLHHELVPFFFSLAQAARDSGASILKPLGAEESWAGDYRFQVGEAFLVAPVLGAAEGRSVVLPEGRWFDWWDPTAPALGPGMIDAPAPFDRIPVYVREGAIVPFAVSSTLTGLAPASDVAELGVLIYPGPDLSRFVLHDEDDTAVLIEASAAGGIDVRLARIRVPTLLTIRSSLTIASVRVGGVPVERSGDARALADAPSGWLQQGPTIWVKVAPVTGPVEVELRR